MRSAYLLSLIEDVKQRTENHPSEYTRGYLDALRYILEGLEEEEENE